MTQTAFCAFGRENRHVQERWVIYVADPVDGLDRACLFADAAGIAPFKKLRCHPAEGMILVRSACGCQKSSPETGRTGAFLLRQEIISDGCCPGKGHFKEIASGNSAAGG